MMVSGRSSGKLALMMRAEEKSSIGIERELAQSGRLELAAEKGGKLFVGRTGRTGQG